MNGRCDKCGSRLGIFPKINKLSDEKPHIEIIKSEHLIECSECGLEWCCLECAIEADGISRVDYNRYEMEYEDQDVQDKKPFVVQCCHCTGKKRCWEE